MSPIRILLASGVVALLCAQSAQVPPVVRGTVDGKQIPSQVLAFDRGSAVSAFARKHQRPPGPDDEQGLISDWQRQICTRLQGFVQASARTAAKQERNISATDAELLAAGQLFQPPSLKPEERMRSVAEGMKLDLAVDDLIAASDPTFRAYLDEYRTKMRSPDPRQHFVREEAAEYLRKKRVEWWNARVAKLDIRLSDPSLAEK